MCELPHSSEAIWVTPLPAWGIYLLTTPEWMPSPKWVLCLKLHGWLIFPSWPPFVWHWPPSHPPPSTPSNSCQPSALFPPCPRCNKCESLTWSSVGPWCDPRVIFFFREVGGWGDKRGEIWREVGVEVGGGVVCTGLTHSHSLTGSVWVDGSGDSYFS